MTETAVQPVLKWKRPHLYAAQAAFVDCPARVTVVEAATKAGKTVALIVWLCEQALRGKEGQNFWWIAPTYYTAGIAYKRMKRFLMKSSLPPELYRIREADQAIEIAGRVIEFKGADNTDSLYGEDVWAVVIDEASRCPRETWPAVRSVLTATRGRVKIIGNVRGRKNWAYQLARRAESGAPGMAYFRLTAWDAVEGGILKKEDIESAESDLANDPDAFKELYLVQAAEDGGNPFGLDCIRKCVTGLSREEPVVFGIDLAKSRDWSVVIGLDAQANVCVFERWKSDWQQTLDRIDYLVGRSVPALMDSTGVGDPIVEELQRTRLNITGFKFSSAIARHQLLQGLRSSIQQTVIGFPEGQITNELDSFEFEYLDTGIGVKYVVGAGVTDDCVMALALANKHYMDNTFHRVSWGSGGLLIASNN